MNKVILTIFSILIFNLLQAQSQNIWDQTYGGEENEEARSIIETKDGGFLIVGYTESDGSGKKDGWAIKIDKDGHMDWDMTYGGGKDDELFDVIELDNGYAMVGYTASIGEGKEDFWLVMTDFDGSMLWERAYGAEKTEVANQIIKSYDGNAFIAGFTKSKGGGPRDIWVIHIEPKAGEKERGKVIWTKNFGGGGTDFAAKIAMNPADSFLYLLGSSNSSGNGGLDAMLFKMDVARGNIRAKKNFGGRGFEHGNDFCFTENNGYLLAGGTMSNSKGFFDAWVVKLEEEFYSEWEHTYGGGLEDEWMSIVYNKDSYLLAGFTASKGEGKLDGWLMMLDTKGKTLWERTLGDVGNDKILKVIKTSDESYIAVGMTDSTGEGKYDFWVVKFK